jgi:hypothetical protein
VSIFPLKSGQNPGEDDEQADEFPLDGFWQFMHKFFGCANPQFHQLSRWRISDEHAGEEAVMWRSWLLVTRGLQLWGRLDILPNSLKLHWRLLMVEKLT